jgi:hypothetical protein
MARMIADAKTLDKVIQYHANVNEAKKQHKRSMSKKVAEYVAMGIDESIALDMVRFGL